ncbi:unnamed protein product [Calypogeia fissa]
MASGDLDRNPVLEQQQEQQNQRWRTDESIAGRVFEVCTANYGRQRTLARLQSTKDGRRELNSASILSRIASPFAYVYTQFIEELNSFSLPFKTALAASICSILCFLPGPLSFFNSNGAWAVITVDMVLEANVGLTFSQGINLTLGTLTAAALALFVNFLTQMSGKYEPFFLIFMVFLSGALATMFKFRPPFRDRWNLAVAISLIVFHVLVLAKVDFKNKVISPFVLLASIVIGFFMASVVTLGVAPKYAGSAINELVAKNFERAGNVMERCVSAYCEGIVLEEVTVIGAGEADDHNIHISLHEIAADESEVERLLKAVPFEPSHGKFFSDYPWDLYGGIKENLRQAVYDVLELESCLHSEIQAPLHLRRVFEDEFQCIGKECAQVFRKLGESIRTMRRVHDLHPLQQAEEGALLLQYKIAKYTSYALADSADSKIAERFPSRGELEGFIQENVTSSFQEVEDVSVLGTPQPSVERVDSNASNDSVKSKRRSRLTDGHEEFLQRQGTLSRQWDTTVQRIAALSLIKFAAVLIELVIKARFVVASVGELEIKAHFEEDEEHNSAVYTPQSHEISMSDD